MRYKKMTQIAIFSLVLLSAPRADAQMLRDVTTELAEFRNLQFRHINGASGQKYFIEPLGSGIALFDFDNDADLDIYFVNGGALPGSPPFSTPPTNVLYRNDGTFTDVTAEASVGDTGYGFGCCVGDYNNDGLRDLYVTNDGINVLYENNGDGTFTNVTERAGVGGASLSTGCAFVDYDADGWLDLYVVNYVQFSTEANRRCSRQGIRTYCTPEALPAEADILYRNNGDGTFTDVTKKARITETAGKGLGVVCGDIDNDGDVDIFVANDTTPNFLYLNNGDGTFIEDALFAGVALGEDGRAYSGMGANLGDFDNDGYLDIVITNFQEQTNSLYHNAQDGFFTEVSFAKGVGEKSLPYLAWGVDFVDFDNDGWLDLFVANGHLDENIAQIDPVGTYAQPNQLFWNERGNSFSEFALTEPRVYSSRGAAFGDVDNDGDVDIVVSNMNNAPTVLRNDGGNARRWLRLQLIGTHCNRDAIGARATVVTGDLTQIREVKSGSGYLSQNELHLHFGLGDAESDAESDAEKVDSVTIRWPCGRIDTLQAVKTNQVLVLVEK